MQCDNCGYDFADNMAICPWCGAKAPSEVIVDYHALLDRMSTTTWHRANEPSDAIVQAPASFTRYVESGPGPDLVRGPTQPMPQERISGQGQGSAPSQRPGTVAPEQSYDGLPSRAMAGTPVRGDAPVTPNYGTTSSEGYAPSPQFVSPAPPAPTASVIQMKANKKYMNRSCPVCMQNIFFGDEVAICERCDVPYHKDCFPTNGCTTDQCKTPVYQSAVLAPDEKFCVNCGKRIKKMAAKCKFCGVIVDQRLRQERMTERFIAVEKNAGTNSIILGVLSLVFFLLPLLGIICAVFAMKKGSEAKKDELQASAGSVGYVLGLIGLTLAIGVFIISIIMQIGSLF